MVVVLNNYGGFCQLKVYVNEARKAGGNIHLPCVNRSESKTSIKGKDIFLGFDCLQNLEGKLAVTIPVERSRNGDYNSRENFVMRTGAGRFALPELTRSRCFGRRTIFLREKDRSQLTEYSRSWRHPNLYCRSWKPQ